MFGRDYLVGTSNQYLCCLAINDTSVHSIVRSTMRIDIKGSFLDGWRFVLCHKGKAIIGLFLAILAASFGIANALGVVEVTRQGLMRFNVFLVLVGERGFVGYFFWRFLVLLLLVVVMAVFGFRPAVSWISYIVIVLFSYQAAFFICLMFIYGGLTVLPLMLVVIVPSTLIALCILLFFTCVIINLSHKAKVCRTADIPYYAKSVGLPILLASITFLVLALLEAALVMLFTMGITL